MQTFALGSGELISCQIIGFCIDLLFRRGFDGPSWLKDWGSGVDRVWFHGLGIQDLVLGCGIDDVWLKDREVGGVEGFSCSSFEQLSRLRLGADNWGLAFRI